MMAYQRILCPVDASAFSRRALRHAFALAGGYDAEVVVMSVRPPSLPPSLWFEKESAVPVEGPYSRDQAEISLRAFVESATGSTPGRVLVADGQIVPEILRVARELPADLIVIGTHGLGGFERLLLGSITEKVLRKAECPVMTIPRLAPETAEPPAVVFKTIVCGMDRSAASKHALDHALSLAQQAGGRLIVVHALEDVSEEEPSLAAHLNIPECWRAVEPEIRAAYEALVPAEAREWCKIDVRIPFGKAYSTILDIARQDGADLIVLGTAGWSSPFGATTQHVLRAAECPVLVVPSVTRTS
jgi:nucleotide-binding universal stress UspA family protein